MRVKVKDGTADQGQQPLCETCRWSTLIRGAGLSEKIVECGQLSYENQRVPFPVVSCSAYADRTQASLKEMEGMAWILRSDPHRTQAGFTRSSQLKREERY